MKTDYVCIYTYVCKYTYMYVNVYTYVQTHFCKCIKRPGTIQTNLVTWLLYGKEVDQDMGVGGKKSILIFI